MSKVIMFSCQFSQEHPRAGEPTYFVEVRPGTKDIFLIGKNRDVSMADIRRVATNDGLSLDDLWEWIVKPADKKDFVGQIICWNNKIQY